MAEKWYRIPISNSMIKVSSIEFVTPIVQVNATTFSFRLIHKTSVMSSPTGSVSSNTTPAGTANILPDAGMGPAAITYANNEIVTSIRNDIINVLTDNGIDLINNFPDL